MRASIIKPELEEEDKEQPEQSSSSNEERHQKLEQQVAKKRNLQIQFLENENTNLTIENEDLNTTLKINKDIIRTLLTGDRQFKDQVEFTFEQLSQENRILETKIKALQTERDSLHANFLLQKQIMENEQEKKDEIGGIWQDEIDDLKEGLERKEYLLQLAEQRVSAFEKLLFQLGARDPIVQRTLAEQNIVLKDRKITNVVIENNELKEMNKQLLDYNNDLREQLEQVLAKLQDGHGADPELVEEISIFQNKMSVNYPTRVLDQVRNKVGNLE